MEEQRLIYLASPYSSDDLAVRDARFEAVCREAARLMQGGVHAYSPIAHTHPIAMRGDLPTDWAFWESYDRVMIDAATEVWVLMLDGWQESRGVAAEIKIADEAGKPVRYVTPVEASRTPVETALCWMCGGHQWIDKRETDENPWWSASTGGEQGQRWPVYSLHAAPGVFSGELIACPFCKPVPPSPEAVEPPLTCKNPYCDNGLIRPDTTFGPSTTSPCPDCQPVDGCEHAYWTTVDGDTYCHACRAKGFPEPVESSQEGSETGAVFVRDGPLGPGGTVAIWRAGTGVPWFVPLAVEAAIARDAEERAREAELAREVAHAHAKAAEERATQAEGQRDALETALMAIRDMPSPARPAAMRDIARRALSPSTEAPSEEN